MPVIVPQPPAEKGAGSIGGCICFGNLCEEFPEQFNPIAGANVTLTGTYPDITFAASGGGAGRSTTTSRKSLDSTRRDGRARRMARSDGSGW